MPDFAHLRETRKAQSKGAHKQHKPGSRTQMDTPPEKKPRSSERSPLGKRLGDMATAARHHSQPRGANPPRRTKP